MIPTLVPTNSVLENSNQVKSLLGVKFKGRILRSGKNFPPQIELTMTLQYT